MPAALLVLCFAIVVAVEFFNLGPLGTMARSLLGTASLVLGSLFLMLVVLGTIGLGGNIACGYELFIEVNYDHKDMVTSATAHQDGACL